MRRVVRSNDVDAVVDDCSAQRVTVGGRFDRGVAFDLRPERRVARLLEPKMMRADFGSDALAGDWAALEQLELARRRQMQDVEPRAVFFREADGHRRRAVAGLFRSDRGMR